MRRRALLVGAGAGIGVSLAGCLSTLPFVGGGNHDSLMANVPAGLDPTVEELRALLERAW